MIHQSSLINFIRQRLRTIFKKSHLFFSQNHHSLEFTNKIEKKHIKTFLRLSATAAEKVRRSPYFLPKVGRSRYACKIGSLFCRLVIVHNKMVQKIIRRVIDIHGNETQVPNFVRFSRSLFVCACPRILNIISLQ